MAQTRENLNFRKALKNRTRKYYLMFLYQNLSFCKYFNVLLERLACSSEQG